MGASTILLAVPGYTGSGPGHWLTLWERDDPRFRRVEQRDWDAPVLPEWVAALEAAVAVASAASVPGSGGDMAPVVLVGHSLGSITIAHWAASHPARTVVGAFLVAPADVGSMAAPAPCRGFAPVPMRTLPFPSVLVASANDPVLSRERAAAFAGAWGSALVEVGNAGHLDTVAGYGPWPEGRALFEEFVARLEESRTP
jgi:serine hydrolase